MSYLQTLLLYALIMLLLSPRSSRSLCLDPAVNYPVGDEPWSVVGADLDGDGDIDLVTANWRFGDVSVLKNRGNGTFAAAVSYSVGTNPRLAVVADLDGDNDVDVAVANNGSANVSILKNNGDGAFAPAVEYSAGDHPYSVYAAKLDLDSDVDLVIANYYANTVSVLKNNGNGTFTEPVASNVEAFPVSIVAVDLDSDGDSDLAVANFGNASVSVLKNYGNGTFAPRANFATRGSGPWSVTASDLDGDDDVDLAVANHYDANVSVLKNNGNGTFAQAVTYAVGSYPRSVAAADMDLDGDADLVVANCGSGSVSVLQNNGNGVFSSPFGFAADAGPFWVSTVDLDGDEDFDLAVANRDRDNVSVLNNCFGDEDSDAVPDTLDNCPSAYNPSQTDTDADSIGDACDECIDIDPVPWGFGNGEGSMWPSSWWQQFNYCKPITPCSRYCLLCNSSDFPNWELFVAAVGPEAAYFDTLPGQIKYRPSAIAQWEALRGAWTGSCFGFAATASLFYDGFLELDYEFPGYATLAQVPLTAAAREMINKHYLYQFGFDQQKLINAAYTSITPAQTLAACKEMFNKTPRNDRVLMMFNQSSSGGHAVVPYACHQDGGNPDLWYLKVHDSNFPSDTTQRVAIDLASDAWSYSGQPGWGGSRGLFLLDSVSNYTQPLILADTAQANEQIRFYFGDADSASLTSTQGTIGFGGNTTYGSVPNSYPIIPADGQNTLPIGYFLPTGEWFCQATGVADGVFTVLDGAKRVFRHGGAKSGIISCYYRANSTAPQLVVYGGSGGKGNRDIYDSSFVEVIVVEPDSEIVIQISSLTPSLGDSISVTLTPQQEIQVDNFGASGSYDLLIQVVTATEDTSFYHDNIVIDGSTSHIIDPDWRAHHDSVQIVIDTSMTGVADSTATYGNAPTPQFVCGDAEGSGSISISDAVYLINYIFAGGPAPVPVIRGDADCSGLVTISDAVYLIYYIFAGGPVPCAACEP